jgi:uncharacterized membrane protein
MRELLSNIEFAKPIFFWLALALPVLWARFRGAGLTVLVLRTVVVLLLILSLADPQRVSEQSREEERVFAFDLSRSIAPAMRRWMEQTARDSFAPQSRDRVFVFASEAKETADWRQSLDSRSTQGGVGPEKTSLENLLATVTALPPAPRNLFLFTDGWETQGNVERLLPSIGGSGLKVFPVLPPTAPGIPNVAVTKLLAPTYGTSGEAVKLKLVLENQNSRDVDGTVVLTRNGEPLKTDAVKLRPGSHMITYDTSLPENSATSYRATFKPRQGELDNYTPDNQALAWVTVRPKSKVLLLNGQNGGGRYLEEIFKRQGFEVTSRTADSPPQPAGYGVVVFNNVTREKFSPAYLAAVERYVANGGGFVILGGEASFAPGSYRRTPIEALLPVEPKEPKREEKNRAVILLVDKSGSMREENRMLYAQEAAKAVARQLKDNDLLGIIGFDVSAFVVVPLEPVARLRGTVDAQINRLRPGGQTYFYPALLEAKRQIERAEPGRKHVILLSDGETRGTQGELIDLVSVMKNEMKITVSAVAIGADADVRTMKRISQYGGGLFHHTADPSTLPQIVLQQIQDNQREEPKAEKEFTPVQERGSAVLAGFPARSYPSLRGYMETELKKGAHMDLAIPRDDRRSPLLASWQYGRGKSVAFTTDLEGRWSRNWIQWRELQSFWEQILGWLRPREEPIPVHEARVSVSGNQPVLDLFAYEDASVDSRFRFAVSGKSGRTEGTLKRLAAGHFQAVLPISAPGDYRIELTEDRGGRPLAYPSIGYTLPYSRESELPRPEFNHALLAKLAQASGGEINPPPSAAAPKRQVTRVYTPARQPLIIAAFLIFLLEIAIRKLLFSEPN